MKDSHASESGDMNLNSDVSGQVSVDLGLLGRMYSGVNCGSSVIESLVSDFIDHLLMNINYKNTFTNKYISIN